MDTTLFFALYGMSHQSVWFDAVGIFFAEYAAYAAVAILTIALLWPKKNREKRAVAIAVSVIAAFVARYILKSAIVLALPRPRPFVTFVDVHPLVAVFPFENLQSFPSGHTLFFFALAAALYGFNKKVGIGAFAVAVLVGVSRIYVGVHWPSDVLGGAVLGTGVGLLAYYEYKRYSTHIKKCAQHIREKKAFYGALFGIAVFASSIGAANIFATEYRSAAADVAERFFPLPELDIADYNARMLALAHFGTSTAARIVTQVSTTSPWTTATTSVRVHDSLWPIGTAYPEVGALIPFHRIVAYYGNFYSRQMGVLGEYSADEMLAKLASTTALWEAADPNTPVIPAIQYIAVVAQASAGKEGKYILRMPDDQIDYAINLANRINGIVFLDVQVGQSTLQYELPQLEKYLAMPNVHLAIDPEFSMKHGERPGTVIGTFDATDINYAAEYLSGLVSSNKLPPKMLIVHRFTRAMVTNYQNITPLPEVQIVMDMDGFGSKDLKYGTYSRVIHPEPVQFTGMKLFYKNDARSSSGMLSPEEVLKLTPSPIYIQYQ